MLGFINLLRGNLDAAEPYYKKALQITPRFVESMIQVGFVYAQRGDSTTAQQWYDKALQEDPSQPRANMSIADLYFLRDEFEPALEHYVTASKRAPKNFQALVQAGVCDAALTLTKRTRNARARPHATAKRLPRLSGYSTAFFARTFPVISP